MPHRRLGKIIVATDPAQVADLERIDAAARANGVCDLLPLDAGALAAREPRLRGVAGLLSPTTGIVDSHALMLSLQGEAEDHGASVAFRTSLVAARPAADALDLEIASGAERIRLRTGSWSTRPGSPRDRSRDRIEGLSPRHRRAVTSARAITSPAPPGCRSGTSSTPSRSATASACI